MRSWFHTSAVLLLVSFCSALDSEGTSFNFAFIRNTKPDITNQVLTATVLNGNNQSVQFTLTYRSDYHKSTPAQNLTVTVSALSYVDVPVPSWYGFNYSGNGIQEDVYLGLTAVATLPVTVIANNYDNVTKQGDSYLVLPTTWASTYFTFSLPPAISTNQANQYEQLYIVPVDQTATVTVTEYAQSVSTFNFNVTPGSPTAYIGTRTGDVKPRTYKVVSSAPVQIVAGVTCAGQDATLCDHVVYMPQAPPTNDCGVAATYNDNHLVNFITSNRFFVDIPGSCSSSQTITETVKDVQTDVIVSPSLESPLVTVTKVVDTDSLVNFKSSGSHVHVARYFDGSAQNKKGAFLATVPALSQWHKDYSQFFTKNANDTVEIYCTVTVCIEILIDNKPLAINHTVPFATIDGSTYYYISYTVADPGYHRIDLDVTKNGSYAYFVHGVNGEYSYGYEGGLNKPQVVLAPGVTTTLVPSTTAPTTTTPGAQTSTTAVAQTTTTPGAQTTTAPAAQTTTTQGAQTTTTPGAQTTTTAAVQTTTTQAAQTTTTPAAQTTTTPAAQTTTTPAAQTTTTPAAQTTTTPAAQTTTTPAAQTTTTPAAQTSTSVAAQTTTTAAPTTVPTTKPTNQPNTAPTLAPSTTPAPTTPTTQEPTTTTEKSASSLTVLVPLVLTSLFLF